LVDNSISYETISQQLVISDFLLSDVERAEEKRLVDQEKVSGYVYNTP
jgi:hypothetical protein